MKRKLALFSFFDALGWEIYRHYGFMADETVDARPLQTVFGFSSAADPSILSGRYPESHGHWSSFFYAPERSPFKPMKLIAKLPRQIFDRWRVRHWLSKLLAKAYGFTGYFEIYSVPFGALPYFDYLEKRDYFVPGGLLQGDTIFDWMTQRGIPYHCSNWRQSERDNIEALRQQILQGEIRFAYLYLPGLDGLMHSRGTRHPEVEARLRWYEQELRSLLALAREHYDDVSFYAFSDHGMHDVLGSINLIQTIEATGLRYGTDYVAMYDSTMARFWFPNPAARQRVEAALAGVPEGRIVSAEDLERWHCQFGDSRFGELIFLLQPGWLIVPSFMGLQAIPGMHGYDPADRHSHACVLSNRPLPADIHDLTDLRGLMEAELSDRRAEVTA
ncbi:MAG: alkaline phosphatase family protein [Candidatus Sericytochromatia bacterium]